ncbi:MAG: methyl-accepting chemotaxis protein [Desulfovibrionaceae bacterium]|nr:methyl-accepting chemotaxis protein [Desulfovibrionaceae bacterium]
MPHATDTPSDPRQALNRCAGLLDPLLPRLARVIKDREEDFLGLGAGIFQINAAIGRFSTEASGLATSVGAGGVGRALTELGAESAQAREIFSSVTMDGNLEGMDQALVLIKELDQAMGEFHRLVKTLKVLGITTRIESARLGSAGQGFTTLADDVESLAAKIVHYAETIRGHSRLLLTQVGTAQAQTVTHMRGHAQTVRTMFDNLFASISELEAMRGRSANLVDELAQGSRLVAESMGQIIASMQFHDITRQQVEHVEEILAQAVREIQDLDESTDPRGLASWVRDVLRLQAPQLRQARDMFHNAVTGLMASMSIIGQKIEALEDRITALAYGADDQGQSILDTIRANIAQVIEAMRQAGDQASSTGAIMAEVAGTVSQVAAFVADIEEVGAEIELIAINASVKAAHTGDQGRALGVLAVAIQRLSVDARQHTALVTEKLTAISRAASRLNDLAQSADVGDLVAELNDKFSGLLDALAGLDSDMKNGVLRLSEMTGSLTTQIREATGSIHVHTLVGEELDALEAEIAAMGEHFTAFKDELDAASQPEKLKEQLSRYTMDSERLVHLAVIGHESGTEDAVQGDDVELFDDNIELFDGVELFDETPPPTAPTPPVTETPAQTAAVEVEEDLGDNVELF